MEDWNSDDRPRSEDYLSRYTQKLIECSTPGDETKEIIEKGEAFIAATK
jgi:hypothetical protein